MTNRRIGGHRKKNDFLQQPGREIPRRRNVFQFKARQYGTGRWSKGKLTKKRKKERRENEEEGKEEGRGEREKGDIEEE